MSSQVSHCCFLKWLASFKGSQCCSMGWFPIPPGVSLLLTRVAAYHPGVSGLPCKVTLHFSKCLTATHKGGSMFLMSYYIHWGGSMSSQES